MRRRATPGRLIRAPLTAVSFLTIIPVPAARHADGGLTDALPLFPLVGAGVGAAAGGALVGLTGVIGHGPATVAAIITLALLTGALHLDGLADSADALGVRGGRERRLEVMKGSTIGTFGTLALLLWALLLYAALRRLPPTHALLMLLAAESLARSSALIHARLAPPARSTGLGASLSVSMPALAVAIASAAIAAYLAVGAARTGIGLAAVTAIAITTAWASRKALGGRTGDTLGATIALAGLVSVVAIGAAWS